MLSTPFIGPPFELLSRLLLAGLGQMQRNPTGEPHGDIALAQRRPILGTAGRDQMDRVAFATESTGGG